MRPSVVNSVTRRDVCGTSSQFIAETQVKSVNDATRFNPSATSTDNCILTQREIRQRLVLKHLEPLSGTMNGSDFLGLFTLYESECENIFFLELCCLM